MLLRGLLKSGGAGKMGGAGAAARRGSTMSTKSYSRARSGSVSHNKKSGRGSKKEGDDDDDDDKEGGDPEDPSRDVSTL